MAKQSVKLKSGTAKVVPITGGKDMVTVTTATTAKPANVPPPSTKPVATDKKALALVDPRAMSLDVGFDVISKLVVDIQVEQDLTEKLEENTKHQNGHLGKLTYAFWNAARIDPRIKLPDAFSEVAADAKSLRLRLEVAAGIRKEVIHEDGRREYPYADKVKQFYLEKGEDKTSPEGKKKENFRTNFATQFTKCMKTACELFQRDYDIQMDKASGLLTISGKAVKEHFQVDKVVLNEKKEGFDAEGKKVAIDKIPSFTGLAKLAAVRVTGREMQTRGDSRIRADVKKAGDGSTGLMPDNQLERTVVSLIAVLSKTPGFSDAVATALQQLQEQISTSLKTNKGLAIA